MDRNPQCFFCSKYKSSCPCRDAWKAKDLASIVYGEAVVILHHGNKKDNMKFNV